MATVQRSSGHRRRALAEINVVPYIDVMLVLLIIFMVTAPLITPSAVKLPSVGQATRAPDTVVEVDIKADKLLSVRLRDPKAKPGTTGLNPQPTTMADLQKAVAGLAQQSGSTLADMPVLIAADKDVKYDDVIKVLNRLKESGVQRVGLAVQATGRSARQP
ncbi:MAG: ExbD/TolR family protein [Betaproteobacteria bacterium]|nr:ExbD/TolR family protein [Betaproteobacteria bacterium]MDE2123354.1 ExbD/TolR family protein [Betaproteobacteria bacterium]MDE2187796.1 ExbD/TolR family protein [Betaproteobacteria bacterium]MDE2323109.1 ExbD/TolR family protein [Betaproteobacteria bacterium]